MKKCTSFLASLILLVSCNKADFKDVMSEQSIKDANTATSVNTVTSATPFIKLILFDGQSEAQTPLDTTIVYVNSTFSNAYVPSEGDKLSNTTNRNQIAGMVGSQYLSRDCVQTPTTSMYNAVPLRLYRLDYQVYGIHIICGNFPSGISAYMVNSDAVSSTKFNLNSSNKDYYINFNPSAIPSYSDALTIRLTKP